MLEVEFVVVVGYRIALVAVYAQNLVVKTAQGFAVAVEEVEEGFGIVLVAAAVVV